MDFMRKLVQVASGLVSCSFVYFTFDGSLFSYHTLFMMVGFELLMTEGVLAGIGFRVLDGVDRGKAIRQHMRIQLLAVAFAVAGAISIFSNKVLKGKSHLASYHSKMGLVVMILTFVGSLGGAMSFKSLGWFDSLPGWMQPKIKGWHRNNGIIVWLLSLATIELGLQHSSVQRGGWTTTWQAGIALVAGCNLYLWFQKRSKMKDSENLLPGGA